MSIKDICTWQPNSFFHSIYTRYDNCYYIKSFHLRFIKEQIKVNTSKILSIKWMQTFFRQVNQKFSLAFTIVNELHVCRLSLWFLSDYFYVIHSLYSHYNAIDQLNNSRFWASHNKFIAHILLKHKFLSIDWGLPTCTQL